MNYVLSVFMSRYKRITIYFPNKKFKINNKFEVLITIPVIVS